jgi:hypothetical protein
LNVQPAPSKIHLATKAYLAGWASEGLLRPMHTRFGAQKSRSPAAVAWRRDWWGAGNPDLNRVCEDACGRLESVVPELLTEVEDRWPLELEDRAVLAQFVVLHIVRTQAFADWFIGARENSLETFRDRFTVPEGFERFREEMRSDKRRALKILRMINKLGTLIASMHWTLIRFDEPVLITSDQPTCPVPLLEPGAVAPVAATPETGWIDTVEVRFPLTPRLALLGTWWMAGHGAPVDGTWAHAVNLNGAVRAQAHTQWFHSLDRAPALPAAISREPMTQFEPISPEIIPGYSMQVARESDLRERAKVEGEKLIESQDDSTLTVITAQRRAGVLT